MSLSVTRYYVRVCYILQYSNEHTFAQLLQLSRVTCIVLAFLSTVLLISFRRAAEAPAVATMAGYGVTLVEFPAAEGKLEEMYKQFTEHPMGGGYTASQPGFLSMDVAIDTEKNSLLFYSH